MARLMRALGGVAIALVNATLILVILAALSVGYLVHALDDAVDGAAERATRAVFSAADIEPDRIAATLETLAQEIDRLREDGAPAAAAARVRGELARISQELAALNQSLRAAARPQITIAPETVSDLREVAQDVVSGLLAARRAAADATDPDGEGAE